VFSLPQIAEWCLAWGLPAITADGRFPPAGGLMAYGPNQADLWRRSATYMDNFRKGARAADLLIEQPTTFDFVINPRTAQALGLTIPPHGLLQATELIR
jgi:putative tryptophan/tyrosine transport system substrate-binding protein